MLNPAAVLENEMHKFLWDFNVQMDHQINDGQTRRSYNNR